MRGIADCVKYSFATNCYAISVCLQIAYKYSQPSSLAFCLLCFQTPNDGNVWLEKVIAEYRSQINSQLNIPKKRDGSFYCLNELTEEQLDIACVVLEKIREWVHFKNNPVSNEHFKPLRMTVAGSAGSGKSTVINTLVTVIRQIFQHNNAVHVVAPTGAAAFNVGGQTIHRLLRVNVADPDKALGENAKAQLGAVLQNTVALFFDERSMISQKVLGAAEINASVSAHNFGHDSEDWGGIPVVVLFGDDCQIPPTLAAGAFESLTSRYQTRIGAASNGRQQFLQLSQQVLELKTIKRQLDGQQHFLDILQHCRHGNLTREHCDTLMSLHLNNFSPDKMESIKKKATYIFANREPMKQHNMDQLRNQHSPDNPVAQIKSSITNRAGTRVQNSRHFRDDQAPKVTNICRGAKVQISGRNFEPDWGLFNGAIGTVKEIVYSADESPIEGHFPQYVIVEFPQYRGPPWMPEQPTVS